MIDRLNDFHRLVTMNGITLERPKNALVIVESDEMKDFSILISKGNLVISRINDETEKLKLIGDKILNAVGEKEEKLKLETDDCLASLSSLRSQGKDVADNIKSQANIQKEKLNRKAVELENPEAGKAEMRVIENLSGAYIKNFENALSASQSVESDVKNNLQKKLLRGVTVILGREPNDDEKRDYLENPEKVQELMENKITQGQAHITLQNKVKDLELRHKEILQLENVSKQIKLY